MLTYDKCKSIIDIDSYLYGGVNMNYADYALLFKTLSDETRLKIVSLLSNSELCACELLSSFNITQPTLSYHMKMLVDTELVTAIKDGSWVRYKLNTAKKASLIAFLQEDNHYEKEGCETK